MPAIVNSVLTSKWTKVVVFLLCLSPAILLALQLLSAIFGWQAFQGDVTANPIEYFTHATGDWTLRFLCITLAVTPLRKILRVPQLIRFRRMLGLFAFFYVCLHFTIWFAIDHFFNWHEMWGDVLKRRFITVGFLGFVLLIPLAVTSTAGMIRRLGGKRWQLLHRLIYVTAVLGVIHYYWLVKSDVRRPLAYGAIVALLLAWRFGDWIYRRIRKPVARTTVARKQQAAAETETV
jgi:sulfoxide reductase heme-binding subunit YedZ